jgi:tetratricopeptide (TPR) repeat protein
MMRLLRITQVKGLSSYIGISARTEHGCAYLSPWANNGGRKTGYAVAGGRRLCIVLLLVTFCLASAPYTISATQNLPIFDRLERVAGLIRKGELTRAEGELDSILRAQPLEANALNLLGVVRAQQQRTEEAEKLFLRAIEIAPALVGAYLNLGQLYLDGGKRERALWAFDEASKLAPDRPDVNYNLAGLYAERDDYQLALNYLGKIPRASLSAEHLALVTECYLHLGRTKEAQAVASSLVRSGALSAEATAALAASFAERKLLDTAIEILEAARQRTPDSFPLLYNLATSYYQKAELGRAEEYYTAGLALKPDDVETLRALARVARARGELEKALGHLIRARKIAPDSLQVLYDFGWTALNLNLLFDAIPVLERLHRAKPDEPGYLYALAIARLHNGEAAEAQQLLNRFIELRPDDSRGYYVLGATLYSVKQYERARASLERSVALAPYADAEYYLGMIAYNQGDAERAAAHLQRALKSEPDHWAAHSALGMVYARQKNYAEARAELERAIKLHPEDGTSHYQLGIVYARLGEKELSQTMFATADKLRSEKQKQEMVRFRLVDPPK